MADNIQDLIVSDELLVDVVLVKRGEDLIFKQAVISKTLFHRSPMSATSQIFSQIGTKFLDEEQKFLERAICTHSSVIRSNNLNQIYVYIVIMDTVKEVDGEETVTACAPMIYLRKPCEIMNEQFKNFSRPLISRIQAIGRKFRVRFRKVHELIYKYKDSIFYEEIKDVSDGEEGCPICLENYTIGSQVIRLPCDHLFCFHCIILWLIRDKSCPLCRYQLVIESPTPVR